MGRDHGGVDVYRVCSADSSTVKWDGVLGGVKTNLAHFKFFLRLACGFGLLGKSGVRFRCDGDINVRAK
jgi:hypothetical protein